MGAAVSLLMRVRIVHQFDPSVVIPSGIDTFVRGLIKAAPSDFQISIVGLTTEQKHRPVGRWTEVGVAGRRIAFLPVGVNGNPLGRSVVPLSLKLTLGIWRYRNACTSDCDILVFHRLEPLIPLLQDPRPKTVFLHQDMRVIRNPKSDIRWKYLHKVYFALERRVIPHLDSIFCVRQSSVSQYQQEYESISDRFRFVPTWMDPDLFYPVDGETRRVLRGRLQGTAGIDLDDQILAWVGRLDEQKDPLLAIEAFAVVQRARPNTHLIVVGDGVLRPSVIRRIAALELTKRVTLIGVLDPEAIADLLRVADVLLVSSAYEGMPICVLEALGCGVPVVTTAVGEVERVVHHGTNGQVVREHTPASLASAALKVLSTSAMQGAVCTTAVREFVPRHVLAAVFDNYRGLLAPDPIARSTGSYANAD